MNMGTFIADEPGVARRDRPGFFFVLLYLMSAPFWLLATLYRNDGLPDRLPITDVGAVFLPVVAAALLRYHAGGWRAVGKLLARCVDLQRTASRRRWLLVAVGLPIGLCLATRRMHQAESVGTRCIDALRASGSQ